MAGDADDDVEVVLDAIIADAPQQKIIAGTNNSQFFVLKADNRSRNRRLCAPTHTTLPRQLNPQMIIP